MTVAEPSAPVPGGQEPPDPTPTGTYWARKRPLSAREVYNARQVKSEATHEVTCRAKAAITPTSILTFAGESQPYHVEGIVADEWGVYQTIRAVAQAGEATS